MKRTIIYALAFSFVMGCILPITAFAFTDTSSDEAEENYDYYEVYDEEAEQFYEEEYEPYYEEEVYEDYQEEPAPEPAPEPVPEWNYDEPFEIRNIVSASVLMEDISNHTDFENFLHTINNNQGIASAVIIRITGDITYPSGRGALTVRHPNVTVVPGLSRQIVFTTNHAANSSMFMVQAGGGLTIDGSGGSPGGSFDFIGSGRYGTGTFLAITGTAEIKGDVIVRGFPANAVHVNGGDFTLSGGILFNNRSDNGNGGGVRVRDNGTFNMYGGIIERNTAARGGGVYIESGSFNMYGGQIINNFAMQDGGGLFVFEDNLTNVRIEPAALFHGNIAQNGIRINTSLALLHPQIRPNTVSVPGMGEYLNEENYFSPMPSHAFTNYDINTSGPRYWRVEYGVGSGSGDVSAMINSLGLSVPDGAFVPENTEIYFITNSISLLEKWNLGERQTEYNEDGGNIPFSSTDHSPVTPFIHTIERHTRVLGHFGEGPLTTTLTISKRVTGQLGDLQKHFEFTVIFKDAHGYPLTGHFNYAGGKLDIAGATDAPSNGQLFLDEHGQATFWLKHGQFIVIEDVPLSCQVQIIENEGSYNASFVDSAIGTDVPGNDTSRLPMSENRVFAFTNYLFMAPPMGLSTGSSFGILLLAITVASVALTALVLSSAYLRRR